MFSATPRPAVSNAPARLSQHPAGRLAAAIGLSLLAHFILLAAPALEPPAPDSSLPPLVAKLEPLPQAAVSSRPKEAAPDEPRAAPAPETMQEPELTAAEEPPVPPQQRLAPEAEPAVEVEEEVRPAHPLPRHAELTFSAHQGSGGIRIGEAVHRLDIAEDGQYTLAAVTRTTGLAGFFKSYWLTQTSRGRVAQQGLEPDSYREDKQQSSGMQNVQADFDRAGRTLRFSHGGATALPEHAQDILSFLYQLAQMPMSAGVVSLSISNGKKLEDYELEIGEEEEITSPLGTLRALPLRKRHARGEEGLEVWLGLEYRLLPVKVRQIDRAGQVAGEMVVSEIRLADE